jgi:hypothetical protein
VPHKQIAEHEQIVEADSRFFEAEIPHVRRRRRRRHRVDPETAMGPEQ